MPRKSRTVKSNRTILLVVEGQTERIYFSEMNVAERLQGLNVKPKESPHSDIEHVLSFAISEKETGAYDSVWCVYDKDTLADASDVAKKRIERLRGEAKRLGIKFAESMPSFEVWFLLHFVMPQLVYSSQDKVIEELRRYIPEYNKEKAWLERKHLYRFLKDLLNGARNNGLVFKERNTASTDGRCTSCNVYEIFDEALSKDN